MASVTDRSQMEPIETSWQSTPVIWMAYRAGQCWCDECGRKNATGYGKTKEDAIAELLEREDDDR